MQVISGTRDSGKTKKLIKLAADTNGVIVCKNPKAMLDKIYAYGYSHVDVISYEEYFQSVYTDRNYYIDEVKNFLKVFSNGEIKAFTVCLDEED